VLFVSDARTEQEVGRYDCRSGRLAVGDHTRAYEIVQALWAFLGSAAGGDRAQAMEPAPAGEPAQAAEPRPAAPCPDIDGHLLGLRTAAPAREAGARTRSGTRIVDRRLGRLRRDGWAVLSALGGRTGADFDRLAIGPPGVFAVTVRWADDAPAQQFGGGPADVLHDIRQDAASAARRLSAASGMAVRVTPMLAFVGDGADAANAVDAVDSHLLQGYAGRGAHHGRADDDRAAEVFVARGEDLVEVLRELPAVYSLQERQHILDVARRSDLWLGHGEGPMPDSRLNALN